MVRNDERTRPRHAAFAVDQHLPTLLVRVGDEVEHRLVGGIGRLRARRRGERFDRLALGLAQQAERVEPELHALIGARENLANVLEEVFHV